MTAAKKTLHLADVETVDLPTNDNDVPEPPPGRFDDEEPASAVKPEPNPDPFEGKWLRLVDRPDLLIDVPPKTEWLLTRWQDGRDVGVLPRSKTGLITGTGGVGKSYVLTELAIAVATGGLWLGTFKVTQPGHVFLGFGEEDADEGQRRFWRTANALGLSEDERRAAAARIDFAPLHGVPVALTSSPTPGVIVATETAATLRKRLEERGVQWALVILDPLSRWAGGGVEQNNEIATRFCQVIEGLTTVQGNPAVIVAHHSSQTTTRAGESDARGVTGIRDGFRWMAALDAVENQETGARGLRFRNRKSNYSLEFPELMLVRNSDPGIEGTLRLAGLDETEQLSPKTKDTKAREASNRESWSAECEAVLSRVPVEPLHATNALIDGALRKAGLALGEKKLKKILEYLASEDAGFAIRDLSDGAQSKPRQWSRKAGNE